MRTCHGRVVGQCGARCFPRLRPRRGSTNTAIDRWHGLCIAVATAFDFRGARPARFLPRAVSADRPLSTRAAQCGFCVVVLWANGGPCRRPRLDRTITAKGRRHWLGMLQLSRERTMASGPCAFRAVEKRPTVHRARAPCCADSAWLCARRGARSSQRRRPRLDRRTITTGRRHGGQFAVATSSESRGAQPARFSLRGVSTDRPRNMRAVQCRLGVVVLSANAGRAPPNAVGRSSAASPPRQVGGTAFKLVVAILFESRGAQPARFSTCRVLTNRPRSTRHTPLCGLGMVVLWPNRGLTPPHAVGRSSTAPKLRQVGGTRFGRS